MTSNEKNFFDFSQRNSRIQNRNVCTRKYFVQLVENFHLHWKPCCTSKTGLFPSNLTHTHYTLFLLNPNTQTQIGPPLLFEYLCCTKNEENLKNFLFQTKRQKSPFFVSALSIITRTITPPSLCVNQSTIFSFLFSNFEIDSLVISRIRFFHTSHQALLHVQILLRARNVYCHLCCVISFFST